MLKVLLVAAIVAGLIYAVFWAIERRQAAGRAARQHPSGGRGKRPPTRMVAPDDDEDFLRDLDRKRHRKDPQEDEPG